MATKSKILVVDDEDTICEVLKLNLEMAGYDVDTANSAEAAMKKPLADYDLYIIDVMMGEMNGFDFASKIRATEALKEIPIIICTAKDSEEDLLDGFSRGIDDYVKKPFSIRELVVRIKSVLRRTKGGDTEQVPSSLTCNTLVLDAEKKLCTDYLFRQLERPTERVGGLRTIVELLCRAHGKNIWERGYYSIERERACK